MTRRVDVAVVGAGPAGCAAAVSLARAGARVLLADRATFPREKVCGDGLLPDALAALAALAPAAAGAGVAVEALHFRTAAGRELELPVAGRVVRRRALDAALLEAAMAAGAEVIEGATVARACGRDGEVEAVTLATASGEVTVAAGAFVVATGAHSGPRRILGLPPLPPPAAAVRGYARLAGGNDRALLISLVGAPSGGYAWAFPVGGGVWNVGCGVFRGKAVSLRAAAAAFLATCGGDGWEGAVRGAPLATSFPRCVVSRGNVLAVGDAAGLARPMSGEGIGPALESGMLAATCLLREPGRSGAAAYRQALRRRLGSAFRAWRFGEALLAMPVLLEPLVARAMASPVVRGRLAGVLAGTVPVERVLSPLGLARLLLGR